MLGECCHIRLVSPSTNIVIIYLLLRYAFQHHTSIVTSSDRVIGPPVSQQQKDNVALMSFLPVNHRSFHQCGNVRINFSYMDFVSFVSTSAVNVAPPIGRGLLIRGEWK